MVIFLVLFFLSSSLAQESSEIGSFNNANSFFISPSGFIYITDLNENKVYKTDTLGNILKETGGFGWQEEAFDTPVDVFATSLNVYVTDKNNHRIQWFDKDLNFISLLQTRDSGEEFGFGYPSASSVNNQGDLLILDTENNRILKFDMFGNYMIEFGGLDAGKFRINRPLGMGILNNITYVLDNRGKRIVVFDQFGNGINIIPLEFKVDNISSSEGKILLNSDKEIFYLDLNTFRLTEILIPSSLPAVRDVFLFNNRLFLLTPREMIILDKN